MTQYKLPLKHKLIYAAGNLGIALITGMHMLHLVYFFFPPKDAGIPYLVPQDSLFLGLTILGVVIAVARFVDAVLDPVVANISDRMDHRLGRRIPMMRFALVPFAVCYVAVFFAPVAGSISVENSIWMFCFLILSAAFFTAYMIPFYSLMVDLAKRSDDKVDLGTISSAFWFFGYLMVAFTPALWPIVSEYLDVDKIWGMRATFVGVGLLGAVCLSIPAYHLDPQKILQHSAVSSQQPITQSLRHVLRNRSFRFYLSANFCYSIATYVYESGMLYYLTVLALKEEALQGPVVAGAGLLTLACYPLVNILAKRLGKKFLLQLSLVLFAVVFGITNLFGQFGLSFWLLLGVILLISPLAQASFGILPQVITSDCATHDCENSGEDRAGMYMAANGFATKLGGGVGVVLFTSLLLFGKDIGNDLGVRLAAGLGAAVAILGAVVLSQYDEKEILTYMKRYKEADSQYGDEQ